MSSIIVFALVLAVAGGFIAWLGDWLGTKVGKKRMTFWKLRPRHTAMLYTIVSGGLISLLTLTVLIASDNAFKRALLEGPRLVLQNEDYKRQIKQKEAEAQTETRKAADKARQAAEAQKKFDDAQKKLEPVQKQLASVQAGLTATTKQLADARQKVTKAQQQVQTEQGNVLAAQRQVAEAKGQVQALQTKRAHLIAANQNLANINNRLLAMVNNSSSENLIYHKQEQVGRAVIVTRQSPSAIQEELVRFLHDLGQQAVIRGSRRKGRAVVLSPSPSFEAKSLKALSQTIADDAGKNRSVVVVARATGNTFKGESVQVDLTPYDNIFIFRKDAIVASQVIDGTQPEAQILSALQTFFTQKVRTSALNHGLIPQTDPVTGAKIVGAIDGPTTLMLRNKIQQIGANARVTAYARVNTYSSGPIPMLLDFDVKPAAASPTHSASATAEAAP